MEVCWLVSRAGTEAAAEEQQRTGPVEAAAEEQLRRQQQHQRTGPVLLQHKPASTAQQAVRSAQGVAQQLCVADSVWQLVPVQWELRFGFSFVCCWRQQQQQACPAGSGMPNMGVVGAHWGSGAAAQLGREGWWYGDVLMGFDGL